MARVKDKVNYVVNLKNIWFPEQRDPYPEEDKDLFISYWKRERDRCTNGFTIADGQVYIPGWLYFHTVYWTIEIDKEFINPVTGKKTSAKSNGTPYLRDVEWMVSEDLERAQKEQKIYFVNSCRGIGKSFWASSIIAQTYIFVKNSESIISGGNNPDIAKLAEKVSLGLDNIHPVFHKQRIKNNWKLEVRSGWIDKSTGAAKGDNSRILMRNYDDGNNHQATSGTRPLRQIIDETGKILNLIQCILTSMPSWMGDYGFFSLPCMFGTGGDQEKGEDAGKIFNNPDLYNVLAFDDIWEGKNKIARFFPVTLGRNEYKEDWTLYKFLKEKFPEKYKDLKHHPDLDIIIKVSNEEKCMNEFVIPRREKALKSTSSNEIISEKAFYPIVPSECFLTLTANDFPVEAAKDHLNNIRSSGYKPIRVELFENTHGVIEHKFTDKMPVSDFPVDNSTDKEGVIEIVEFPVTNASWGTYVAGCDPYKVSESEYSTSLGSVYIFKRMTVDMTEPYQHMPVAWYTGRPKDIRTWQENVRMLLEFYGAEVMCEANDESFIQYMIGKNKQHYLAKGQSSLREISPTSKFKGNYGLPATSKTIEFWNNSAVIYTKEMCNKLISEDGISQEALGITRILDPMLLEEITKFNKHSGNYDRIRAFSIALAYANQLDALIGKTKLEEEIRAKTKVIKSPFSFNRISSSFKNNPISSSPFLINKFNK